MLRAVLSTSVGVLVTATAHSLGGGAFPPPLLLALVFVAGVLGCFAAGGRRVALPNLVVAIGLLQGLLHVVFSLGHGSLGHGSVGVDPTSASSAGSTGHGAHAHLVTMPDVAAASGDMGAMPSGTMVWAHVVAGVVTIIALRLGASAVRQLARSVAVTVGTAIASSHLGRLVTALITALVAALASAIAALVDPVALVCRRRRLVGEHVWAACRRASSLLGTTRGLRGPPVGVLAH
ncbi:hypothetical protein [Frigoribacterium sp. CFBP 13712]|uniref:hypothetical protein n=1 Tax=Frigoribacterium sp. CFBP 13712 TaxID=2775309 RepID=UPI00178527FF|nr:hypothetical protein [Frigoribacterium sp. CFBP 13712]MBD8704434.1 hypothetical protein [Frigoribacterium sp. CFBP 13712]